jgi:transposase InsO family protein
MLGNILTHPENPKMAPQQLPRKDLEERNTAIALFRYGLIAHLLFDPLEKGQLEGALRAIAAKTYSIPYSTRVRVGIATLRRYLRQYQQHGFEALRPQERTDKRAPRAFPAEVVEKAIALREEQPTRTTAMIVNILKQDKDLKLKLDQPLNVHTLTTHLRLHSKTRRLLANTGRTFQRFERQHANSLWQGDMMFGPWLPDPNQPGKKRRAHLFCFIDDHSRLVPYAEFFFDEALPCMERVLKVGILRRGKPLAIYVDNGRVYASNQFGAACASLGIQKIHAAPYSPEGKGKIERFFETTRLQFMPEVEVSEISTLSELNESFWAWLECVYHTTTHRETEQTPLERYQQGLSTVRMADPEILRKAFLWRETRKVHKDGCIELQGNRYEVDAHLAGRKLELRFDPFDLSNLEVFLEGIALGNAGVLYQEREKHIAVEHLVTQPAQPPKPKSSLDYLAALRAEYQTQLRQAAGPLQFTKLSPPQKEV